MSKVDGVPFYFTLYNRGYVPCLGITGDFRAGDEY